MNHSLDNNTLTIMLEGRIDTSNSTEVEAQIRELLSGETYEKFELDASNLEYISSSGLRILMKLRKENDSLTINNVSNDVYEIFETTGFTEILTINKAYRTISIDNLEVIGAGQTGTVYRINPEQIVKVFKGLSDTSIIFKEKNISQNVFLAGVPTAISYDVVKVGDSYGVIYELLNANDLSFFVNQDIDNCDEYIIKFANFLKACHKIELDESKFTQKIDEFRNVLPYLEGVVCNKEELAKLCAIVDNVPKSKTFVHGDAHIGNVMVQDDEFMFIDMTTAGIAHPIYDLGSMYLLFHLFAKSDARRTSTEVTKNMSAEQCERIWQLFLKTYLGTDDEAKFKKAEAQIGAFVCTRTLLAVLAFPDMFDKDTLAFLKNSAISEYDNGLEPLCF